ncbi:hypothetical protein VHEMI06868 [[Torrubiella] hemipterigena]|uniref:Major facilitator superfamily (MFS) profile domain-containing protein n=1 Tax=[Torrubiella] hemipterigena TaxID=1531966 RepID=A0A0A1TK62_9HYPO|nr:hypothetical protein VHEMI06868 [[Torrubiella] hemipterigena]
MTSPKADFAANRHYFLSRNFIGSLAAIGLASMAAIGGFSLIAPVLGNIDASIGPDQSIVWVSLSNNLTQAIGLTIAGRLSDIFGRWYFQIGGALLALVGCILAVTAVNVRMLIGANVLIGIGSATQVSFPYLIAELVPVRQGSFASAYIYVLLVPMSALAPNIATVLATRTSVGWRCCYYLLVAINALALVCWVLFYRLPTWDDLVESAGSASTKAKKAQMLKNIDYGGLIFLSSGLLLFLMGISWGGSVYAWNSAAVLSTIILGAVALVCFVFYERRLSRSVALVPMHCFPMGLGLPSVAVLYADHSLEVQGWVKCVIGAPPLFGQITASIFATRIGKLKYQLIIAAIVGAAFYAANASVTPNNEIQVIILLCIGGFALGWVDAVCLVALSITLEDQKEIGTGVSVASSLRTIITTTSATIFTAILFWRLASTIPAIVPPALVEAGLPAHYVDQCVYLLQHNQTRLAEVEGVSASVIATGLDAFKLANSQAYSTVYLATIAFSGVGIICSFMTPSMESYLTDDVARRLRQCFAYRTNNVT